MNIKRTRFAPALTGCACILLFSGSASALGFASFESGSFQTNATAATIADDDPDAVIEWEWEEEQASFESSIDNCQAMFGFESLPAADQALFGERIVTISDGGGELFKFEAHEFTPFIIQGDRLVYAKFHPMTSGCVVIAIDLQTQRTIWQTRLRGLGPVIHSKYRNRVIFDKQDEQLVIFGNESSGRYIEVLNLSTGEQHSHRKLD